MKNDNLYKFSIQTPWQFVITIIMYTIGAVSVPESIFTYFLGDSQVAVLIAHALARLICCILPIWLVFEVKLSKIFSLKDIFVSSIILVPFLLVVINNFPIFPLITKDLSLIIKDQIVWFCYIIATFFAVLLEEITFRALIFPAICRIFNAHKHRNFLAVLISSALFGVVHLFNLFAGASIGSVAMQVGYSFLIGAMCAIAFLKTGSFYSAVLLHFIFNIGGLLADYGFISGYIWTNLNIVVTAVLAVIVIVYAVYLLFFTKTKGEYIFNQRLFLSTNEDD
ncbi:MAG: CPBP family intramembrane metalloprotease [Clostridia bacterium]|nr:CPBP family intramembrane metalloprotease [Clostridia bacterium]